MSGVVGLVRRAVVATNPWWPFSALNRAPYRVAIAMTARRMRRVPGVRSLYLRNSLTRRDWEPGLSDIDLTVVMDAAPNAASDHALLRRVWDEYRAAKRRFPMLGELDVQATTTLGAWSRLGIAGHEARRWQRVVGEEMRAPGSRPGAARFRLDAGNHALFFCLDSLQQRLRGADAGTFLALRAERRIAAKVLAYAALARGVERTESTLPPGDLDAAGLAAVALEHLDAAARELDTSVLWAAPAAGAALALAGEGARLGRRPDAITTPAGVPPAGVASIVDAEHARIVVLRDAIGVPEMRSCFEWVARAFPPGEPAVKVVTPAVFAHWLRHGDPHLYTHVAGHGVVAWGCDVKLPAAPHPLSFAYAILGQAPNAIAAARSREIAGPDAAAFVSGRGFALAVERALFVKGLLASGHAPPSYDELVARARDRHGDVLGRVEELHSRAACDADGAGLAAFGLLRELAQDVAIGIERVDVDAMLFDRAA